MWSKTRATRERAPSCWALELEVEELGEALVVVEAEAVVGGRHGRLQRQERLQSLCERITCDSLVGIKRQFRKSQLHQNISSLAIYTARQDFKIL